MPVVTDHAKARAPFAPWDRRQLPGLFSVEESARRVGNYKWVEMRLFEALGGWVATVPEMDVKIRLGTHCYKHAWHSELWHKRLPELREMMLQSVSRTPEDAELAAARTRHLEALMVKAGGIAGPGSLGEPEAPESVSGDGQGSGRG